MIERFLALMLVLIVAFPVAGVGSEVRLFADAQAPEVAIPDQAAELVWRQRLVQVRIEALPLEPGGEVVLDLFDDRTLWLVCDEIGDERLGSRSWWGHGADEEGVSAHLAVGETTLSGTIRTPAAVFQIRPFDDDWHIVRELTSRAEPPGAEPLFAEHTPAAELRPATVLAFETETARLTNNERRMNGLSSLAWNDRLWSSARGHSTDMATNDYFSHTGLDGRTHGDRMTAAGYQWNSALENIAAGQSSPTAVVDAWMNSPGHRANILNTVVCDLGVGYAYNASSTYGDYWTQNFGRQAGVSTCPPVPPDDDQPTAESYYRKVNAYFLGVLGRTATDAELAQWGAVLRDNKGSVWRPTGAGLQTYLSDQMGWGTAPLDRATASSRVDEVFINLFGASSDLDPRILDYYIEALVSGSVRERGLVNAILNDLAIMPKADGTYGQPTGWTGGAAIRDLLTEEQLARYRARIE